MKIRSPDPRQHPLIDPKYFTDPTDLPDLVAAVKLTREIFNQKAFDEFRGPEVIPGGHVKSDKGICETKTIIELIEQNNWLELLSHFKEIENWVLDACETAYHPSCSAKMGKEDDPMAVVDSSCRVFGTQNLRVVDSSIMPSGTFYSTYRVTKLSLVASGNLNAPTIAIAEKASDIIRGRESLHMPNTPLYKADLTAQR